MCLPLGKQKNVITKKTLFRIFLKLLLPFNFSYHVKFFVGRQIYNWFVAIFAKKNMALLVQKCKGGKNCQNPFPVILRLGSHWARGGRGRGVNSPAIIKKNCGFSYHSLPDVPLEAFSDLDPELICPRVQVPLKSERIRLSLFKV